MIFDIFYVFLLIAAVFCAVHISVADFRRRIIPDAYLFPLLLIGLAIITWFPWIVGARMAAVGAIFGYSLALIVGFIFDYFGRKKNPDSLVPIGMGDIKLIGVGGLWLGPTGLAIALICACLFGIVWGKYRGQKYIPFAPFFITGAFLALIIMRFLL